MLVVEAGMYDVERVEESTTISPAEFRYHFTWRIEAIVVTESLNGLPAVVAWEKRSVPDVGSTRPMRFGAGVKREDGYPIGGVSVTDVTCTLSTSVYEPTSPLSMVQREPTNVAEASHLRVRVAENVSEVLRRAHVGAVSLVVAVTIGGSGADGGVTATETDAVSESPKPLVHFFENVTVPVKY
jgi:hypothetical protein